MLNIGRPRVVKLALSMIRSCPMSQNVSGLEGDVRSLPIHKKRFRRTLWVVGSICSTVVLYTGYRYKVKDEYPSTVGINTMVTLYRKMPLRYMSRAWGSFSELQLPTSLRKPILGLYVRMCGVDMAEAKDEDLKSYSNLAEFFRRPLKINARLVDTAALVTSPSDGKVLHFGKVTKGVVEQVKGVNYDIKGFLGPVSWTSQSSDDTTSLPDTQYQESLNIQPGHSLYHCIIYLAPGDYHRFHSPVDWSISHRRHFPGELLSVRPSIVRWVQGLFSINERVVYTGTWKHGFFSYSAVGATNVGSIKFYIDKELKTNAKRPYPRTYFFDKRFCDTDNNGTTIAKGEMLGEFNMGSSIVLIFEAPKNFRFSVEGGKKVRYGEPLGTCDN